MQYLLLTNKLKIKYIFWLADFAPSYGRTPMGIHLVAIFPLFYNTMLKKIAKTETSIELFLRVVYNS